MLLKGISAQCSRVDQHVSAGLPVLGQLLNGVCCTIELLLLASGPGGCKAIEDKAEARSGSGLAAQQIQCLIYLAEASILISLYGKLRSLRTCRALQARC
jgi:hypothetical protein